MLWYNREHSAHNVSNTTFDRFYGDHPLASFNGIVCGKIGEWEKLPNMANYELYTIVYLQFLFKNTEHLP